MMKTSSKLNAVALMCISKPTETNFEEAYVGPSRRYLVITHDLLHARAS